MARELPLTVVLRTQVSQASARNVHSQQFLTGAATSIAAASETEIKLRSLGGISIYLFSSQVEGSFRVLSFLRLRDYSMNSRQLYNTKLHPPCQVCFPEGWSAAEHLLS